MNTIRGLLFLFTVMLLSGCDFFNDYIDADSDDSTEYAVFYDSNGSESGSVPIGGSYESGTMITLPENAGGLSRSGYVFSGWNTEEDGTGGFFLPGNYYITGISDVTFYAEWDLVADLSYDISGSEVTITAYSGSDSVIIIPDTIDGYPVTAIDDGVGDAGVFMDNTSLTSITLPDSLTSIGDSEFRNCSNLVEVNLPDSLTTIDRRAFSNCSSLGNVTFPDSLSSIGQASFYGCSSFTSITLPASLTATSVDTFSYCTNVTEINLPDTFTYLEHGTFAFCTSLVSVDLSDVPLETLSGAFSHCTSLTTVTLPECLTFFGYYTFRDCSVLSDVTFSSALESLGEGTFLNCTALTSVTLPSTLTSFNDYTYSGCTSLSTVTCEAVTPPTLGNNVFYNNAAGREIKVPSASVSSYQSAWSDYSGDITSM